MLDEIRSDLGSWTVPVRANAAQMFYVLKLKPNYGLFNRYPDNTISDELVNKRRRGTIIADFNAFT